MSHRTRQKALCYVLSLLLVGTGAAADPRSDAPEDRAEALFARVSPLVVQVQVLETETGSKASIGSGFAFGNSGLLMTNFHVVAELIHHPERYRGMAIDAGGRARPLRVLAVDAVHDLAVVFTEEPLPGTLLPRTEGVAKGESIFAIGNPYDLGLSVVEGTYNGLSEHSLEDKVHFSGSLNPGMSGGPALDAQGRVIGINVASAGNQVSFLVPVEQATRLAASADPGGTAPDWHEVIGDQLLAYQDRHLGAILEREPESVTLGEFRAGGKPDEAFSCWGNRLKQDDALYEAVYHQCTTEDTIFVSGRLVLSLLAQRHRLVRSEELGAPAFYALYSQFFEENYSQLAGSDEDFTPFRCYTRFVEDDGKTVKSTFCARRYLRYRGLYDAIFKAATLGAPNRGLETALVLQGVSFENAKKLAARHLRAISWTPE